MSVTGRKIDNIS